MLFRNRQKITNSSIHYQFKMGKNLSPNKTCDFDSLDVLLKTFKKVEKEIITRFLTSFSLCPNTITVFQDYLKIVLEATAVEMKKFFKMLQGEAK